MKRFTLAAGFAALMLNACNSASSEDKYIPKDGMISSADTIPPVNATQSVPVNQPATNVQNMPITVGPNAVTTSIPSNTPGMVTTKNTVQVPAQPTTTAPGMNPPHGQPGHRCDISVGAPLNSKPAAVQQPVIQQQQPVNATMTQQPVAATAPGMNPPHGQPGHRCDISVGAPLNSPKKDSVKQ